MESKHFEVVIVGAGPSGLSCALDLHESRISYVLLEKASVLGGQVLEIGNTLRDFAGGFLNNGAELADRMRDLSVRMKLDIEFESKVESLDAASGSIICSGIEYLSEAIVLATGSRLRRLSVKGLDKFSEDVFYRTESCMERLYGHCVAIVGGGDNALMDALILADRAPAVYVITRGKKFRARADIIKDAQSHPKIKILHNCQLVEAMGKNGKLSELTILNDERHCQQTINCERMIVRAGNAPNSELVAEQVKTDQDGRILVDQSCQSSIPGLYAVGDVASPSYSRIASAMGQGSLAALAVRQNRKDAAPHT